MPGTRENAVHETWFKEVFGFVEDGVERTKSNFTFGAGILTDKVTGKNFHVGKFETPIVQNMRNRLGDFQTGDASAEYWTAGDLAFENILGDTLELHRDPSNAGAVFQVSSMFNCLETIDSRWAKDGISCYHRDGTQGAACAIACPAATVFRNYYVNGTGQTDGKEVDCLANLGKRLQNDKNGYWTVRGGCLYPKVTGSLAKLSSEIAIDDNLAETIIANIQVGVHWETEVWKAQHKVSQVFCSAVPMHLLKTTRVSDWVALAKVMLEAAYEATLTVAGLLAAQRGERVKVFLTAVGGGMLGNRPEWISQALDTVLHKFESHPLDVVLVHFAKVPREYAVLENGRRPPAKAMASPARCAVQRGKERYSKTKGSEKAKVANFAQEQMGCQTISLRAWDEMTWLFEEFDENGDGVIDRREFVDVLTNLDKAFFKDEVIDALLEAADVDGDGIIHYHEFILWISGDSIADDVVTKMSAMGEAEAKQALVSR